MTYSITEIIGREVRASMVRKGWNIRDLAGNLDISPATLSRYLRGRDFPASKLIDALRMLDVDFKDFNERVDAEANRAIEELTSNYLASMTAASTHPEYQEALRNSKPGKPLSER